MDFLESHYTRAQITEMASIESATFDYWLKMDLLRSISGGGGKGKHRKFDAYQVVLAAIYAELKALGLRESKFKETATVFPRALDWSEEHGLRGKEYLAEFLIEYAQHIATRGSVKITHFFALNFGRIKKPLRKMDWDELLDFVRQNGKGIPEFTDSFAEVCRSINFEEFQTHRAAMLALVPTGRVGVNPKYLYLAPYDEKYEITFDAAPTSTKSFVAINVTGINRRLWGSL